MDQKKKRPRIRKQAIEVEHPSESMGYGESFQENAASKNAKFLCNFEDNMTLEFWIDKHYVNRKNFGDDNGERDGIGEKYIENLIKKSLKHLLYYSLKHSKFSFVNYPPPKSRNIRIVLKEIEANKEELNVVVEYHFIQFHKYEVTVITAMRNDDFRISDGQYSLHFEEDESFLMFHRNKNDVEIDTFI